MKAPRVGSVWKRVSVGYVDTGFRYIVLGVTEERKHYPSAVVYQGSNGKIWYKRLADQWPGSLFQTRR